MALSRGRESNRIYATANTGWAEAITATRAHTFALYQQPDWNDHQDRGRRRNPTRRPLSFQRSPFGHLFGARHRAAHRPAAAPSTRISEPAVTARDTAPRLSTLPPAGAHGSRARPPPARTKPNGGLRRNLRHRACPLI